MILLSLEEKNTCSLDIAMAGFGTRLTSYTQKTNTDVMLFPAYMSDEKVFEIVQGFSTGDSCIDRVLTANCENAFIPIFDRIENSTIVSSRELPDGTSCVKITLVNSLRSSVIFNNAKSSHYAENAKGFNFRVENRSYGTVFDLHNLSIPFSFDWRTHELLLRDEADYVQYLMVTS